MAKGEVKTPNKRKSFGNNTPAKKAKIENGNEKTPKKQFQTPKHNQQGSVKKSNKKNKGSPIDTDSNSPKKIKPFAGTKQLDNKKQNKQKLPKNQANQGDKETPEKKKKRRNQYQNLISAVKLKQGSKDAELLKSLTEKISAIQSRGELSKTAKKKLGILQKLKVICEEGADAAAALSKAKVSAERAASKTDKKAAKQGAQEKKKEAVKAAPAKVKKEEDEDSDAEEESDAEESGEEEEESGEEEEDDSDAEAEAQNEGDSSDAEEEEGDDDDDEDDDDEDEDDSDEEEAPAPKEKPPGKKVKIQKASLIKPKQENPKSEGSNQRSKIKAESTVTIKAEKIGSQDKNTKQVNLEALKGSNLVTKGQKRFVLFVGNIPYDTTTQDLKSHFSKTGEILHVRIPTDKGSNRPRGFGYIEVKDEITYQKCLSMHHSQIKGRRINVLYTQGGKKKGENQKKEIKVKNLKLHSLRRQGKLAGSVKESQKRSFRRKKTKETKVQSED